MSDAEPGDAVDRRGVMHIMTIGVALVLSSGSGSQTAGVVSVILGDMKILLTSSSKHGSTDEVAAVIAERLQAAQITVEIKRPEDVDSVDGYDAFILGSAVYMTKWTSEAVDFTKRVHDDLKARPVWAFSVGLSGLPKGKVSDPMRIGPVLLALDPEDHMTFAGRFDPSKLSLRERSIAKLGGATEGDYRDWDEVRQWADAIATSLYDDTLIGRRGRS